MNRHGYRIVLRHIDTIFLIIADMTEFYSISYLLFKPILQLQRGMSTYIQKVCLEVLS